MKNQNKYAMLSIGLSYHALNSASILFTLLSLYGLVVIRKFAIEDENTDIKIYAQAVFVFTFIRFLLDMYARIEPSILISYSIVFTNTINFILSTFLIIKSTKILIDLLNLYDLKHLSKKLSNSAKVVIVLDIFSGLMLLEVLLASIFNSKFLLLIASFLVNINVNLTIGFSILIIKYFAAKTYSQAAVMFNQIDHNL